MLNARNTLGMSARGRRAAILGATLAAAALVLVASGITAQEAGRASVDQSEFLGRVVDAQGIALPGAWVGITGTEWGSISNDAGLFRIPDAASGRLSLTIELLGYETLEWSGNVGELETPVEIELQPRPILLEGLEVMVDRFRSRRNAAATSVFAYEPAELSSTSSRTALEFIESHTGAFPIQCRGRRTDRCFLVRGQAVEPAIYIDETPIFGGLEYLESLAPWEFHMIEVYGGGRQIRAYTPAFMERVAEHPILPLRN